MQFFTLDEFKCACCGQAEMDESFLRWLDILRYDYEKPIIISSGYRCPSHNSKVSKTGSNGPHTTGKAVDIKVYGKDAYNLLEVVFNLGYFEGIGIKQTGPYEGRFIHLDSLSIPNRPWIWSY